jgi:hypothetical protein
MKILLADYSTHYKVLGNVFLLIDKNIKNSNVDIFINKDNNTKGEPRELLFPYTKKVKWKINKLHHSLFFLTFIFIAHRYKVINISTGPEGSTSFDIVNILCFYLAAKIYGKKIILTIKNTRPYLAKTSGFFSFVRNKAIQNIKLLTFETETLMYVFQKEEGLTSHRLCVSYDRYTDLRTPNNKLNLNGKGNKYLIGMLGAVESERRNYLEIIKALESTPKTIRNKIRFVTLGNTHGGLKNSIIESISKLVSIDASSGWISEKELNDRASICDVLISPLREEMEYGTYKGSGTFGDAVFLRKKVIIPGFVDPENEFEELSICYNSVDELTNIFKNIDHFSKNIPSSIFFRKFSSFSVYKEVKNKFLSNIKK